MGATTTRLALPYPLGEDSPPDVAAAFAALAQACDNLAPISTGTLGGRPPDVGIPGRLYYSTDNGLLYYSTGSAWISINNLPLTRNVSGSSSIAAANNDDIVVTSGSQTITLPTPSPSSKVRITNIGTGATIVTQHLSEMIYGSGLAIGGVASFILGAGTITATLESDGTSWFIIAGGPTGYTPVGSITAYAGGSAPAGYLMCDGTFYPTTSYGALYAVVGTAYGAGAGTFAVPDLRGRVPIGVDTSGAHVTGVASRGVTGGEQAHSLAASESGVPSHTHSVDDYAGHTHSVNGHTHSIPGHTHGMGHSHAGTTAPDNINTTGGSGTAAAMAGANHVHTFTTDGGTRNDTDSGGSGTSGSTSTGTGGPSGPGSKSSGANGAAGAASAHNNLQPYQATNWIIKA